MFFRATFGVLRVASSVISRPSFGSARASQIVE